MSGLSIAHLTPQTLTWDTALRLFALRCKSLNLSETTQANYSHRLDVFRRWVTSNGNPKPCEIESNHIREYLDTCRLKGNKDTTVACIYRVEKTFWNYLYRDGLIILNPMVKVERPRVERRFARPFTQEQLRTLLESINLNSVFGLRDYCLILFLADTALRISEALSVKLSDVDWANNTVIVLGKGRKERRVPFGQTARRALLKWTQRRGSVQGCEFLWINHFGQQLVRHHFERRMKWHTKRAGIAAPRLSAHSLRHFFALSYLKNGGDALSLQKLLGHTSLEMVRNYVNMTDDDVMAKHRLASPLDRMAALPGQNRRVTLR